MAQVRIGEGVAAIPREAWNALVGDESPFLEWEFLASLEETGCLGRETGWLPRPLTLHDDAGRMVAAAPLYLKGHSEGEFVFDWSWADAASRAGIPYYPKLLVGVPFTPVSGARFLTEPGLPRKERKAAIATLGAALVDLCRDNDLSGVHVNFCRPDELGVLQKGEFVARVGMQYHWANEGYADFEAYLARFRSKRRNQIRRELRGVAEAGIEVRVAVGDEIDDAWFDPMFEFYRTNVDRHFYGRRYLNRELFGLLRERFRQRLCFVVALEGGVPIAGALNVQKGDALYGRYWGCTRDVRYLHFAVCYYEAIRHCIERGIARFEPGAGGDYKQLRGFDATPTLSAHFLADARLAEAVARYLEHERHEYADAVRHLRRHSALKAADPSPPRPGGRGPGDSDEEPPA
ncbi:MAG TPA: GNAT family N-acetyltransferase [Myxococcota bacterium]|nr:GNAT family N-acetyltransferase [Myxococcota bacterium]